MQIQISPSYSYSLLLLFECQNQRIQKEKILARWKEFVDSNFMINKLASSVKNWAKKTANLFIEVEKTLKSTKNDPSKSKIERGKSVEDWE